MDEDLKLTQTDEKTLRRLRTHVKSYLYSDYVDDPEIVKIIDQYLLDDSSWYMILIDQAGYDDISDMTTSSILYEVVRSATRRDIDPDHISKVITTVMKLGNTSNNIVSIYYK